MRRTLVVAVPYCVVVIPVFVRMMVTVMLRRDASNEIPARMNRDRNHFVPEALVGTWKVYGGYETSLVILRSGSGRAEKD